MKRTLGTLALIGAIALLAGGCGGKKHAATTAATTTSASAPTSAGPLSKAAYDTQMAALGKIIGTSLGRLPAAANAKEAATAALKAQSEIRAPRRPSSRRSSRRRRSRPIMPSS